ncbi:MAG TPA: hypothetical protein VF400_16775 [Anaeromyxobacteraceae bacterium]
MTLSLVLRFFHVLAAALWIGSALFWPGALRRALAAGTQAPAQALAQARAGAGLDLGIGLATVATGIVYLSPAGGVHFRMGLGLGLGLALLRIVLLLALARPALRRITEAVGAGDLEAARAAAKALPAYAGAAHLLWLLALACMIFPV